MALFRWTTRLAAAALVASCCMASAFAQTATPPWPLEGRILFNRWAYTSLPQDAYNRMWRMDADGTDIRALVPPLPDMQHIEQAWSPDGKWIAYIHVEQSTLAVRRNVFIQDANGSAASRHRLTPTSSDVHGPSWSPDGQWIAYNDVTAGCLRIVRPNGSERRTPWCRNAGDSFPVQPEVWADNTHVLIPVLNNGSELWSVDIDTSVRTRLYHVDLVGGMAVSPDGTKVVYATFVPFNFNMTLLDVATLAETNLGPGHNPLWSNDSSKIAFNRTDFAFNFVDPESTHVYVMNADGTNIRRLTFSQIDQLRYTAAAWSGDNTKLLVNRVITIPTNIPDLPYGRLSAQMRVFDVVTGQSFTYPVVGTAAMNGWYDR